MFNDYKFGDSSGFSEAQSILNCHKHSVSVPRVVVKLQQSRRSQVIDWINNVSSGKKKNGESSTKAYDLLKVSKTGRKGREKVL